MLDRRALVVDNSGAIRSYVRRILAAHGFDVIEARNGEEGLERLRAQDGVALVLLDWSTPEQAGIDLLARLRAEPEVNPVCVMMVPPARSHRRSRQPSMPGPANTW